jgi:hypothetical protein
MDVKSLGNNTRGRILRGQNAWGHNVRGRIIPVPDVLYKYS